VYDKLHNLEGSGDRSGLDVPNAIQSLHANPSKGRIAYTRKDIKDENVIYAGVASNVSSRTTSPRNDPDVSSPERTETSGSSALPATVDGSCNTISGETDRLLGKPPLASKLKSTSLKNLSPDIFEGREPRSGRRISVPTTLDETEGYLPVRSPPKPRARRSSRLNMEKINFRLDSRVEFHMAYDAARPPTSFKEHFTEMLGFPDVEDDGAEEDDVASASREVDVEASAGRQRVYNLLVHVPWQFECMMFFGAVMCLDAFLTVTFVVPFRGAKAALALLVGRRITPEAVVDLAWVLMIVVGVAVLLVQDVAVMYHFIRGQEVVKLYVVFNLLEVFERLLNTFGVDALDAVSHSAGKMMTAPKSDTSWRSRFAGDVIVGTVVVVVHSLVVLMQAITINVAINSKSNQLLALMISNNFVEMKGAVFKKMDARRHLQMACLDIYERYHMQICLLFVMIEMLNNSKGGAIDWTFTFLRQLAPLFVFEFVVDHLKHAFLCKYNEIQPNVFRDYLAELCRRTTRFSVHKVHRLAVFEPMALTCVVIRAFVSLRPWKGGRIKMLATGGVIYVGLFAVKALVSWTLQNVAWWYMERHRKKFPNLYIVETTKDRHPHVE